MKVCLVIPCYNESKRLDFSKYSVFLHEQIADFLFVDDGSKDNTYQLLQDFAADYPQRVQVMKLERNFGKAEAVRLGMLQAAKNYELVGFWDADLAVSLNELPRMLKRFAEKPKLKCLLASRVKLLGYDIQRKWYRHYLGRVFATAASLFLELPVYDTQCGAKLFTSDIVPKIFAQKFATVWIFDVEILFRLRCILPADVETYINEIPLLAWQEVGGSKIKVYHYFLAIIDFIKLLKIKRGLLR